MKTSICKIKKLWLRDGNENTLRIARKLINGALEIDPQYVQVFAIKGHLLIAEKNRDSVYFYAKRIMEIDSEAAPGYWLMGIHHQFNDETDEAIDNYQLAIKYFKPEDIHFSKSNLEISIGRLYFRQKYDVLKALLHYQKAFDLNTDSAGTEINAYADLSFIFSIIGDYDRAEMYDQKIMEVAPNLDGWFIILHGQHLGRQGKYNQVINFLDSISDITIRQAPITYGFCVTHLLLGNLDQAEQYYNQWLSIGRGGSLIYAHDFAYLHKKLGEEQEAIDMLNEGRAKWEEIPINDRTPEL